jgi:hypothetical protein
MIVGGANLKYRNHREVPLNPRIPHVQLLSFVHGCSPRPSRKLLHTLPLSNVILLYGPESVAFPG